MQQPDRELGDGAVQVELLTNGRVRIKVATGGVDESITCGPHNAWRVFGLLAFVLGIRLPAAISKAIKL